MKWVWEVGAELFVLARQAYIHTFPISKSSNKLIIDERSFKLGTRKSNIIQYTVFQLFVEGLNSDVLVHALGHTWNLHRLYLEQCDYFRALFQGNWCDS